MSDLFEEITGQMQVSLFRGVWNAAEDRLRRERPGDFRVDEIGHLALSWLSEEDREKALGELFCAYWEAVAADPATLARQEELQAKRGELHLLLGEFAELTGSGSEAPHLLLTAIARLAHELMGGAS